MIRNWVSEIRDIAYDAEDIIDTFILQIEEEKKAPRMKGFMVIFNKYAGISNKGKKLHNIGRKIKAIQKRLSDLSIKRDIYEIRNLRELTGGGGSISARERLRLARRSSPYADGEDFIGLNDAVEGRCVISIVGMGGLGKTSLAKKVYNHSKVQSRFHHQAWVYLSQEYNTKDLFKRIIKFFRKPSKQDLEIMENSTEEDLERFLYEYLERPAWESMKRAFLDKNNGSRVVLTTRKMTIAEKESWELFCKIAFRGSNGGVANFCPPHLEDLGREMVRKCGGLPLGIIVLGSLLSKKSPNPHEWQKVLQTVGRKFAIPVEVMLSPFPEDFVIDTKKLIWLWVNEGFVPQGEDMKEVADIYLNELIERSMIQVVPKGSRRRVVECAIHDLLRDLAVSKAEKIRFLQIFGKEDIPSLTATSRGRRLATHSEIQSYVLEHCGHLSLRSLMIFNMNTTTTVLKNELRSLYTGFKLLRVLDLGYTRYDKNNLPLILPDEIGKMIHLRYLGLEETNLQELPASIGNLQMLQTLNMWGNTQCKLPETISKLGQPRHLYGSWTGIVRIDTLTNLKTLDYIDVDIWVQNDVTKLTNLQKLKMTGVLRQTDMDALSATLSKLSNRTSVSSNLQSLWIQSPDEVTFDPLMKLRRTPLKVHLPSCYHLLDLILYCYLECLPDLQQYSPNLTTLILFNTNLKADPMPTLEMLPHLSSLNRAYDGSNGFPQLEHLEMSLTKLQSWTTEERAMSQLTC
ncbi:hypothetical protein MKX01_022475 [Papaver californicum]|nr:hypothetical protein MKX01_022475 [Papaver californicum]